MNNFEIKANHAFKQQIESLDIQTLRRLRNCREKALAHSSLKRLFLGNKKWLTGAGAGLAFATVLTFMIIPNLMQSNTLSPLDDFELLSAEADLDLVTQMDFYQWLDDSALSENTL